ncbi:MAG: hypothetical protein AB7I96_07780 [Candidatus Dadabacteria bacterium]
MIHKSRLWFMDLAIVALMFFSFGGLALGQEEAVVGEERLTESQEAAQRLYNLDAKMTANYTDTQRLAGQSQSPVILVMFNGVGGKYILIRNGNVEAVEPVPALYQQIKSASHTIVGVFEIMSPYFDNSGVENWKPKLTEYNKMLKDALATLGDIGMPPDVEERCRTILEGGIKFTDGALKTGSFTSEGYSAYAKSVWPAIAKNIELAGKLQVDHFEALLKKWRKEMGEEEWSRLYAVVNTAWAMRRENVHFQILAQMMGRDVINDRLIIAETLEDPTQDDLIMLLGRIINDRDLAVHVFGKKLEYRMDVELMGNAAKDEITEKASPHHPVIDYSEWMPYEEHKTPDQE